MGLTGHGHETVDENIAVNLRLRREAAGLSQEDVAHRMTELGFGFSQATIWKIEQARRPVKVSEAVALGQALNLLRWTSLLDHPDLGRHEAMLESRHRNASAAYKAIGDATRAYLWAQMELAVTVSNAREAGVEVHQLWTAFLDDSAERAVVEARVAFSREDVHHEQIDDEVSKIVASLREHGYDPVIDPDAIERVGPAVSGPTAVTTE